LLIKDFCIRNIDKSYLSQNYFVDKESIIIDENKKNKISFILKNKNENNNNDLKMRVYILKMGIFRIKIDDLLPKEGSPEETKNRFKVIS